MRVTNSNSTMKTHHENILYKLEGSSHLKIITQAQTLGLVSNYSFQPSLSKPSACEPL